MVLPSDEHNHHSALSRRVAMYQAPGVIVSTAYTPNMIFETAVMHPRYFEGDLFVVEYYGNKIEAEEGHERWIQCVETDELPNIMSLPRGCRYLKGSKQEPMKDEIKITLKALVRILKDFTKDCPERIKISQLPGNDQLYIAINDGAFSGSLVYDHKKMVATDISDLWILLLEQSRDAVKEYMSTIPLVDEKEESDSEC